MSLVPMWTIMNGKCSIGVHPPTVDSLGRKPSEAEADLYKRYEQEQAMVQEELLRLAKRERDAARERLTATLQQERNSTDEERQKTAQLLPHLYSVFVVLLSLRLDDAAGLLVQAST
ncbi:UNVERIFIED_CONTAM: hypothetical protein K2H54_051444 [Gekko kuhli]